MRHDESATVHNTDTLLGRDGFVGVKTGSDEAAGGCFAFRAISWIDGKRATITGVVLGQRGYDRIAAGLEAANVMVDRITGHQAGRIHSNRPGPQEFCPECTPCEEPFSTQSAHEGETVNRAFRQVALRNPVPVTKTCPPGLVSRLATTSATRPRQRKRDEPLADLLTGTPAEVVIADKGFWGRGYRERLAADGVTCSHPTRRAPPPTSAGSARSRRPGW